MAAISIRSGVEPVRFQVFDRILHPELLDAVSEKPLTHAGVEVTLRVTPTGHVVDFLGVGLDQVGLQLQEIVGRPGNGFPTRGRVESHLVRNSREAEVTLPTGSRYYCSSHADSVEPEVFDHLDRELQVDAFQADLTHRFHTGNRLAPSPQSMLRVDLLDDSIVLHATHTFPDECVIVRTQSLLEV